MNPSPPATIGKYQIIREIARSNDIVYEAYDPGMNRRVAVKELSVPSGSSPQQKEERVRRFQREVKAAGSLTHPNIVTVYEVGEDVGRHFMAMEFLDGQTLRNEIDSNGKLDQVRAIQVATDILCALDFAHNHGVIHRDVKPENIQILTNGTVKLTDFGIARLTFEPNITMDGQVFGTPSYMSPEQVEGREIDLRSDLFSVGTVLYEMLTGTKPFTGDNVVSIATAIMQRDPPDHDGISWAMQQVVDRALQKSAGMRFASAKDFVQSLERVRQGDVVQPSSFAAPMVPPPVINYDPYAQQPGPAPMPYGQPQVPGYQPYAYGQVPIYYPPPPRPPLIKPETRLFLGRLVLTFLVMAAFCALVFVALQGMTKLMQRGPAGATSSLTPAAPSDGIRAGAESKQATPEAWVAYAARAKEWEGKGQSANAEESFQKAVEASGGVDRAKLELGEYYIREAMRRKDQTGDVSKLLQKARENLVSVTENDPLWAPNSKKVVESLLKLSEDVNADPRVSRQALYLARQLNTSGKDVDRKIEERLSELGG